MKKFVILASFVIASLCASTADAYNWFKEYEFPARRILLVPRGHDNYDHIVYSFNDAQGRPSLLFVCHGSYNDQGEYFAYMGGNYHKNYAAAVDNEIRYHINRGEIGRNSFDKVYFLTCHSGYAAQKTVTMPVLNKTLQMVIYNKGVQGLSEYFDSYGRVYRVVLLQDHPDLPGTDSVFKNVIIAGDSEE